MQCEGLTFVGTDELGGHVGNLLKGNTQNDMQLKYTFNQAHGSGNNFYDVVL